MFGTNTSGKRYHPKRVLPFLALAAVFVLLVGGVIMLLWNAVLPGLIDVQPITYWKAVGLFLIVRILIGGLRFGLYGKRKHRRKGRKWKEKWMNMSPEERAQFKAKWKERCDKKRG